MIGRIFLTGERTSWVILLTDLNSRIPVTIEPGNAQAIMAGDNSPCAVASRLLSQGVTLKPAIRWSVRVTAAFCRRVLPIGTDRGRSAGGYRVVAVCRLHVQRQDVNSRFQAARPEQPPAASPNDLPVTAAGLPPAAPPPAATRPLHRS